MARRTTERGLHVFIGADVDRILGEIFPDAAGPRKASRRVQRALSDYIRLIGPTIDYHRALQFAEREREREALEGDGA